MALLGRRWRLADLPPVDAIPLSAKIIAHDLGLVLTEGENTGSGFIYVRHLANGEEAGSILREDGDFTAVVATPYRRTKHIRTLFSAVTAVGLGLGRKLPETPPRQASSMSPDRKSW